MLAAAELAHFTAPASARRDTAENIRQVASHLEPLFGAQFCFWNAQTGDKLLSSSQRSLAGDALCGHLARAVGREPQFIIDEDCLLLLAVPLTLEQGVEVVATAPFVVRRPEGPEEASGAARLLGVEPIEASSWMSEQTVWSPEALLRLARSVQARCAAEARAAKLEHEVETLSNNLASTYEEICLLHGLTQNLRIRSDDEQLCQLVLPWLLDCLPATCATIQLLPVAKEGQITYKARTHSVLKSAGQCPIDNEQFTQLIETLHLEAGSGPLVANRHVTGAADWPLPQVRQVVIVPLPEQTRVFGWLAIINHNEDAEFGTVEASLLNSIGAMLGIHSSNRDLYRLQSEFLASVVRAFTSAIDAKDPYTCGHSDRVARISVRLAKELGCDAEMLHTLYMAGLLHDIGKIGIDDSVLRKPGKLTDAEFDHIKEHPGLGYRILADLSQLSAVLPAVLHHHEQWDGRGYPAKLVGDQIPLIARICAVADAYDAMTSDRPYRKGMPLEKVDEIFKAGAGKQWDPDVIAAYFSVHDEIREMARHERANLTLDVEQWV